MVDALVKAHLRIAAKRANAGSEATAVVRTDSDVVQAGDQQHRRGIAPCEGDRLARRQIAPGRGEEALQRIALQRQEIIGTGETDDARDMCEALGVEQRSVERQHRGDIGAGGMSHQEREGRIGAELEGVAARPPHGLGAVMQEIGKANVGVEPVVGDDRDDAALGERHRGELVVGAFPVFPSPAVEEDDKRRVVDALRRVDIEKSATTIGEADVVDHLDVAPDGKRVDDRQTRWGPWPWHATSITPLGV